jgi:hypothetical protein
MRKRSFEKSDKCRRFATQTNRLAHGQKAPCFPPFPPKYPCYKFYPCEISNRKRHLPSFCCASLSSASCSRAISTGLRPLVSNPRCCNSAFSSTTLSLFKSMSLIFGAALTHFVGEMAKGSFQSESTPFSADKADSHQAGSHLPNSK